MAEILWLTSMSMTGNPCSQQSPTARHLRLGHALGMLGTQALLHLPLEGACDSSCQQVENSRALAAHLRGPGPAQPPEQRKCPAGTGAASHSGRLSHRGSWNPDLHMWECPHPRRPPLAEAYSACPDLQTGSTRRRPEHWRSSHILALSDKMSRPFHGR